jgi:hypothetical protein
MTSRLKISAVTAGYILFGSNTAVKCSPILGQVKLEFVRVLAHGASNASEPFVSVIGGLFPIALCGLTSL